MDHRITIAVVVVFGGTLMFTFFIASVTSSVKQDGAQSVFAAIGAGEEDNGEDSGEATAVLSPREELARVLHMLDDRVDRWTRDHGGRRPDFETYPAWEQFLEPTDADGRPSALVFHSGTTQPSATQPSATQPSTTRPSAIQAPARPRRYLAQAPVNPLNHLGSVVTVDQPMRPADRVPASVGQAGFVYSTVDQCFWGTNGSGRVILTSARPPATATARPAPAATPSDAPTPPTAD